MLSLHLVLVSLAAIVDGPRGWIALGTDRTRACGAREQRRRRGARHGRMVIAGVLAGVIVAVLDLGSLGAAIVTGVVIGAATFARVLGHRDQRPYR